MPEKRYLIAGAVIAVLVLANIIRFIFADWGLITVRVHEKPLSQIIKSIEWQGGVTIYTNIDPATPVSMDVIKVPLAEAMESLAANIPPPDNADGGGPARRGFGGGGFGGGAQWKLAFFAAPTSAQVKQEIRTFQGGGGDDDTKIYSYPTRLQMLASDSDMPVADPRLQVWSGVKTPPPPAPAADGSSNTDSDPPVPPSTIQDYLDAVAEGADIWIMSPGTWENKITAAPDAGIPVAKAVKELVGRARGSVEQAFVLYTRPQGQRGGQGGGGRGFVGGDTGWSYMEDRMRNAINGLPPAARPEALNQLAEASNFQKQLRAATPDTRRQMIRARFMSRLGNMDNWRASPERRAQMYQRAVSNRQNVVGKS